PINLSEVMIVLGCTGRSPECLGRAAEQLAARVLIYGNVKMIDDTHRVTIEIFDASRAQVVRRLVRTLEISAAGKASDPVIVFRKEIQALFLNDSIASATKNVTVLQI